MRKSFLELRARPLLVPSIHSSGLEPNHVVYFTLKTHIALGFPSVLR